MKQMPYILIVDDEEQVVRFITDTLHDVGYEVSSTTSGTEALAMIKARRPDLLILDLNMPEPDGFNILRVERSLFPYLRILVISGYLTETLLDAARFLGAVGTLQKPLSPETLQAEVRAVLGS